MNQCEFKHALVLGAATSGEWAARLLLARGVQVTLLDEGDGSTCAENIQRVQAAGGTVLLGRRDLPAGAWDLCVASPAFALQHVWIAACQKQRIPVISELELGATFWTGKILAVTGSKGKSSLVKFCADTLMRSGISASPAGNYGIPLSQLVMEQPALQWAITEVSSFQMEHSANFHPQIGILLNLQPDHMDRHTCFAEYRALKFRMFANMDARDRALLPADLETDGLLNAQVPCSRFGAAPASDWRYVDHAIVEQGGADRRVSLAGAWFDNEILGLAAAAAVAALTQAGLSTEQIESGFAAFEPLAHRVQVIGTDARGVTWVDDSKATSLTATAAALRMVKKPVRLIAGGLLKENDLNFLKELLTQTTQKVYLIGKCAGVMADAWASVVPCEIYGTIERAVQAVAQDALPQETVLLSPGTASFDQFNSYKERGERFTRLVRTVADL